MPRARGRTIPFRGAASASPRNDLDEWSSLSRALEMQRAGDELFARAGLSANEHRRRLSLDETPLCLDQGTNALAQPLHRRGVADELVETAAVGVARIEVGQRALQPLLAEGLVDQDFELAQNDRLHHVVVGPAFHRIDGGLHAAVSGDADDLDPRVTPPNLLENLKPVQIG